MAVMTRWYSEMLTLKTYAERLEYLACHGRVGEATFDVNRYFNQSFYQSEEWKRARASAIIRDNGLDLAVPGLTIEGPIYVHHINPITMDDIETGSSLLTDLDNLVCCSRETHNKIHFGPKSDAPIFEERTPFDTCPWRR